IIQDDPAAQARHEDLRLEGLRDFERLIGDTRRSLATQSRRGVPWLWIGVEC
ncbi:MAG: hypothetical protein K0R41_4414, partial [Geminicoccaceae bacterium]|nr:hypothetical protein [Geminicoccaceae bacterium]